MPKLDITFRQVESPEIIKSEKADERKITFVASDGTRDSAGTILNQEGWDLGRFNKNGIIGYQHKVYGSYDSTDNPDNVIGKGRAYVKDKKLMVDVEFEPPTINPLAEKVYQKLLFGSLKAVSVGFLPKGRGQWGKGEEALDGKNPTYYYAGQELLEVSVVNIPANPNALRKDIAEAMEAEQKRIREEVTTDKTDEKEDGGESKRSAAEIRAEIEIELARAALL